MRRRKSLLWDFAPVVTQFEAHNQSSLWFERLFERVGLDRVKL